MLVMTWSSLISWSAAVDEIDQVANDVCVEYAMEVVGRCLTIWLLVSPEARAPLRLAGSSVVAVIHARVFVLCLGTFRHAYISTRRLFPLGQLQATPGALITTFTVTDHAF